MFMVTLNKRLREIKIEFSSLFHTVTKFIQFSPCHEISRGACTPYLCKLA